MSMEFCSSQVAVFIAKKLGNKVTRVVEKEPCRFCPETFGSGVILLKSSAKYAG